MFLLSRKTSIPTDKNPRLWIRCWDCADRSVSQGTSRLGTVRRRAHRRTTAGVHARAPVPAWAFHRYTIRARRFQHIGGLFFFFLGRWRTTMRLCEHLHAFWQGWLFRLLSREGPMVVSSSRSGTARHQDARCIAPHASLHVRGILSGVGLYKKTSICRGDVGACSMQYITLISLSFTIAWRHSRSET